MDSGRDKNSLAGTGGQLKDRLIHQPSDGFVKQTVFTQPRCDMDPAGADHVVEFIRRDAGRVDDASAPQFPGICQQLITCRNFGDGQYFRIKPEFHTVFGGVFRQGDVHTEGAYDTARRGMDSGNRLIGYAWFQFMQVFLFQNAKIGNTVFDALPVKFY